MQTSEVRFSVSEVPLANADANREGFRITVLFGMTLPGIGRTRAEAIVLQRVRHGPFRSVARG